MGNNHTGASSKSKGADAGQSLSTLSFELVPTEIWFEVLLRLPDLRDLLSVTETCQTFNKLVNHQPDGEIWRQLCYSWALELQQEQIQEKEASISRSDAATPVSAYNQPEKVVASKSYVTWKQLFIESRTIPT